jgi:hypothetical protein
VRIRGRTGYELNRKCSQHQPLHEGGREFPGKGRRTGLAVSIKESGGASEEHCKEPPAHQSSSGGCRGCPQEVLRLKSLVAGGGLLPLLQDPGTDRIKQDTQEQYGRRAYDIGPSARFCCLSHYFSF